MSNYQQIWYQITIPNDSKKYGITINKSGIDGYNLTVYLYAIKQDGKADKENYRFALVNKTGSATALLSNYFDFLSGSGSVGSGMDIVAGNTYYMAIMANIDGLSCTLLFDEIA